MDSRNGTLSAWQSINKWKMVNKTDFILDEFSYFQDKVIIIIIDT